MTSNIPDTDASTRSGLPSATPSPSTTSTGPRTATSTRRCWRIGADGANPDPTSAAARMGDSGPGALDSLGGHSGLMDLVSAAPVPSSAVSAAKQIAELAHRRRQHPPHPSHRRQGGDATDQLTQRAEHLATTGQFCWPRLGSSTVRRWADPTGR